MTTRGRTKLLRPVGLLDEVAEHLLGRLEVGDHAVAHRADGGDAAGRPPEHLFRVVADGLDLVVDVVDRHDGRLVEHDAGAARKHAGVGGAEVDRQVMGEERQRSEKHSKPLSSVCRCGGVVSPVVATGARNVPDKLGHSP